MKSQQRLVVERAEAVRIDRDRKVRREQHHAAVRLRVLDVFDRDARRGARLVLDDDGRRVRPAQPLGEDAGDDVGAAAGAEIRRSRGRAS